MFVKLNRIVGMSLLAALLPILVLSTFPRPLYAYMRAFEPAFEPAISLASRPAADVPKAAVFGVRQEKVVKAVPLAPEWIRAVTEALESSPAAYGGFEVNPRSGIVIYFPFAEPLRIRNEKIPDAIRELYLFLEPGQKPRALLFLASSNKTPIFELNYDAEKLVRTLGLKEEWANNR